MSESKLKRLISNLPPPLQKQALRMLYLRNGKYLQDFRSFNKGQFFAYKINDIFFPSESLGWFVDYGYYYKWVRSISTFYYQPRPGDTIIDIGSGIGEEAIVFSKMVGNGGRVISIEANPEVFAVLEEIVRLNGLTNVALHNVAINTSDDEVEISVDDASFLGGSIGVRSGSGKSFTVPGFRFDSFVKKNTIQQVNLLKVNIEGAERFVIDTIGDFINNIHHIAISCHDFRFEQEGNPFFKTKKLVSEYLQANGFQISSQQTGKPFIDDWVYASRSK
jgi:FkbM family methyltransferase